MDTDSPLNTGNINALDIRVETVRKLLGFCGIYNRPHQAHIERTATCENLLLRES
ncbi:hypothetical protein SDC9_184606 [bioreactor metagenome]|uniref:Uncharacterized protein n=1 Tax=bioreactor metagenome TaxID=1076179 RepID=A0A645HEE2_9ZZZZ